LCYINLFIVVKANILFIINPISGGKKKATLPGLITAYLDNAKYSPSYRFTEYQGHAAELAEEAAAKNFDVIVAVGGDGTINEVAAKVMQANKILGVIPFGSGNGLARFLKIPMRTKGAIEVLNDFNVQQIDVAKLNDKYFFNMAGMGFDAHISMVFASNKSRGLKGYMEMGLKEMISYKAQNYQIEIDGKNYTQNAFAVSIANSAQYGNNVYISPNSSITDGLLDVCIVKEFPRYKLPILAYQMVRATTDRSALVEIIQGKHIKIKRQKPDAIHLDGEPFLMDKDIEVVIFPLSLSIITKLPNIEQAKEKNTK
jgi:diacylglycerol kinase (ATP)